MVEGASDYCMTEPTLTDEQLLLPKNLNAKDIMLVVDPGDIISPEIVDCKLLRRGVKNLTGLGRCD